jgi:glycosyltransferase involved in cell wall biosynthesis
MNNLLVISSLYPNQEQPQHGIFVEARLRKLIESGEVSARVIAPVPWFPALLAKLPFVSEKYRIYSRVPNREVRQGIELEHPRYLVIPKIGVWLTPFFMLLSILWAARKIPKHSYDIVDAHYFYPDGVAVAMLAKLFGKPLTITARGSDVNLLGQSWLPRKLILWAANAADANITVCQMLKDQLTELGPIETDTHVMRNGVDVNFFRPLAREELRKKWNMSALTVVSVGGLIRRKGHELVIEAVSKIPDVQLLIAGRGELEQELKNQIIDLGLEDRVRMLGEVNQEALVELYSAADYMVLASSYEGWANVLLEAMACGCPVIAAPTGGTPEVVQKESDGILLPHRTPSEIVNALSVMQEKPPNRDLVREYALSYSWDETVNGLLSIFQRISNTKVGSDSRACKHV